MRIDLVGTTADFRHIGHPQPLPINHLLCENRRTQGRIGEVGLGLFSMLWLSQMAGGSFGSNAGMVGSANLSTFSEGIWSPPPKLSATT
jgi:hypothetical protein